MFEENELGSAHRFRAMPTDILALFLPGTLDPLRLFVFVTLLHPRPSRDSRFVEDSTFLLFLCLERRGSTSRDADARAAADRTSFMDILGESGDACGDGDKSPSHINKADGEPTDPAREPPEENADCRRLEEESLYLLRNELEDPPEDEAALEEQDFGAAAEEDAWRNPVRCGDFPATGVRAVRQSLCCLNTLPLRDCFRLDAGMSAMSPMKITGCS